MRTAVAAPDPNNPLSAAQAAQLLGGIINDPVAIQLLHGRKALAIIAPAIRALVEYYDSHSETCKRDPWEYNDACPF
jgi:hypothetical protein